MRARGIRRVTGYVIGDASWFDDAAGVTGWRPSFIGTESPVLSALEVDGGWYDNHQTHNPPLATAARFDELLRANGVKAREARVGVATPGAVVLGTIYSAPLSDVLEDMDRYSDNFLAEMVLKEIGAEIAGAGSTLAGAEIVRHDLVSAGIPMEGVRIVDGSGLSRSDRATARELATLLVTLWHDPVMHPIVWNGLPVAGHSGTLENRLHAAPAHWNVRAKTGTTDIASALSGYVRHTVAFSVLQNGHPVNSAAAHKAQDRFVEALAKLD
jgi:D-alanyl-D-alanine carboxypeptidase/D-alanyl-D-alanine-endopeptidase (penicillin-binding protein 4)